MNSVKINRISLH